MSKYRLAVIDEAGTVLAESDFVNISECSHHAGEACASADCGQFVLIAWSAAYHGQCGTVIET